ncbi:Di-copper centre-containing protein [Russula vinacea]|nr:Di-copper centre-containing protein [Russula vinacea]
MPFYKLLSVSLAFLWSVLVVSCSYENCTCTKPAIRREWRKFTTEEKANWIRAINCLSQLPHDPALTPSVDPSVSLIPPVNTSGSYLDDIVYLHMDLSTRIHFTGLFLPWHRWFVHIYEESLKNKCGYTGVSPYWNWTIDAPDFYESSFWKDSDPVSGLGGWGDPNADFRVPDGGFIKYLFPTPCLTLFAATSRSFEAILGTPAGDFKGFQKALEAPQGPHFAIHAIVAGDMVGGCPEGAPSNCTPGPSWSPNDPLFFLHHAMVDKIWYDWQSRDPMNVKNFFGGSVPSLKSLDAYNQYPNGAPPYLSLNTMMPADGLFPEVTIRDVVNTTGGVLCYVYE